ncbi:uncharacterized protein LOC125647442 [Ostrea edulis]|uniref:uncharacterized protein LOC125647442 n=1 Tax=Ostrea edulis TaxID=37623 RepID=UPI0024AF897B|nr:uncharacterized protein LOC125647442 [Ostrea edulis]
MEYLSATFFVLYVLVGTLFLSRHVFSIRAPWVSSWESYVALSASPKVIAHPLNEYPAKVDVQIRVTEGGKQHIFSGFGSCHRDDDDPSDFGGIVFIYNDKEVQLYTPILSDSPSKNSRGVFAYTGGTSFNGPFNGYYPNADVRVRCWRMCDFPPANFTSAGVHTVSTSDTGITTIQHNIGYYPDLVIVQLKLSSGYISEAQGAVFKSDASASYNALCGVIMAYDSDDIRLWPVTDGAGKEAVFCVSDGWGTDQFYYDATVYIQAWKLESTDIVFSQTDTRGSSITVPSTITMPQSYNIDTHIFLVQSQAIDGNNANFLFEAAGSALSDGTSFFGDIGAVVYAYNSNEVSLWYPGSGDFIIYVGGSWGKGDSSQSSSTASVTVKVIRSDSILSGCGCSVCTSDWNSLSVSCGCSTSSGIGSTSVPVLSCPAPTDIPNSNKLYDGQINNSITLYSCKPGFIPNDAKNVITCNGTDWEDTNYICSAPTTSSCTSTSTVIYNITTVEQKIVELKRNLTLDTKNTSAYRRSLTCAEDSRPSSAYIGYLGIGLLSVTGGLFLCLDFSRLLGTNDDDDNYTL